MKLDREELAAIVAEMIVVLEPVAERHGLKLKVGGGSFDPAGKFSPKIEFVADGIDRVDWDRYAEMFGLQREWFGQRFVTGGQGFTVSGLATRSRKYPVLATGPGGKVYKFTAEVVSRAFGKPAAPAIRQARPGELTGTEPGSARARFEELRDKAKAEGYLAEEGS